MELTSEQQEAVRTGTSPPRLRDPETGAEYVLVRAEIYDELEPLLAGADETPAPEERDAM